VRGVVAVVATVLVLLLAGCTSPSQTAPAGDPTESHQDDRFAQESHCVAVNVLATVLLPDVLPLVPTEWSLANPAAPTVRVLLADCIETAAVLVAVQMRAGPITQPSAPSADYVVEVFSNSTTDDWSQFGAPVVPARLSFEGSGNATTTWAVDTPSGLALRFVQGKTALSGQAHNAVVLYGGGKPVHPSWAVETADFTHGMETATLSFGPASVLSGSHPLPVQTGDWWGAFRGDYRTGLPPQP
jgi:hypothetical protein